MEDDQRPQSEALARVLGVLRTMPEVIAIAAYGSTADRSWNQFSDVDLVAVLSVAPPVESLRFFVGGVAVDLNFRSDSDDPVHGVRGADFMPEVVAVWDPQDVFHRVRTTPREYNADATQLMRYQYAHDLEKLRQIADEPGRRIACGLLADRVTNSWFNARAEAFPGVVAAMEQLRLRDPETLGLLSQALRDASVDAIVSAAARAFEPVGGPYRPGDVLAPSWTRPKVETVPDMFGPLVAIADERAD